MNPAADPAGTGLTVDNTIATRTVVITGCTIAGNNSTSSDLSEIGGIYALNASPVVTNTIVYGNVGNSIVASGGTVVTTYSNIQDGFAGEGNLNVDPLFVNAAGGDFHLQSGSPCIDRGRDTSGAIYGEVSTDFEGDTRGFDGPGLEPEQAARYDIGADEYTD